MEKQRITDILILAIGSLLLVFSNGGFTVPLAAWIAPTFLLRFSRQTKPLVGLGILFPVHLVAYAMTWALPLPPEVRREYWIYVVAFAVIFTLLNRLAYVTDKVVARRLPGFAATLVFP